MGHGAADPTRYFTEIDGLDDTFTYDVLNIDGDTELELLLRAGKDGPATVHVLKLDDGNLTATTDYMVDAARGHDAADLCDELLHTPSIGGD